MRTSSERFWSKVDKRGADECWLWTGNADDLGRGRIGVGVGSRLHYAHRFSWELHIGPIPNGLYVCHKCDVPACVNPAHLFLGTQKDNMFDCARKGRSARGERHRCAKLSETQARAIVADPRSQRTIAKEYGVSQWTVGQIKRRESWRHLGAHL